MNTGELITAAWDAKGPSKDVTDKLAKLNVKDLEALSHKLHAERENVKKAMLMVQKALSDKIVAAGALRKVKSASSEERAAMLQYLQTPGIPSEAEVGTPGNDKDQPDE